MYGGENFLNKTTSSAQAGNQPKNQTKPGTQDQAGHYREVKRRVLTLVNDISGQASQSKWQFPAKEEKSTGANQQPARDQEQPAEFAKSIHDAKCRLIGGREQMAGSTSGR